mmetsp:Transcript_152997/g.267378  ORF Transcript_152997/g.267378 Transcript_152997/m.267378 type:complete len:211 (+) Transcript_152997:2173-2805(+)
MHDMGTDMQRQRQVAQDIIAQELAALEVQSHVLPLVRLHLEDNLEAEQPLEILLPACGHHLPDGVHLRRGLVHLIAHPLHGLIGLQPPRQHVGGALQHMLVLLHDRRQLAILRGVYIAEAEVLQLDFDICQPKAVCKGNEDVERLLCNPLLLLWLHELEGPHVVQPVEQLQDDDAVVAGHGQQHLPEVLRGLVLEGGLGQCADLCNSLHQ